MVPICHRVFFFYVVPRRPLSLSHDKNPHGRNVRVTVFEFLKLETLIGAFLWNFKHLKIVMAVNYLKFSNRNHSIFSR
jgi:hypothetical protein